MIRRHMSSREYSLLEYDKIKDMLAAEAVAGLTRAFITTLEPSTLPRVVSRSLDETSEARAAVSIKGAPPLGDVEDIKGCVSYAEKGGALTMRQLIDIGFQLAVARKSARFPGNGLPDSPVLSGLAEALNVCRDLEDRIGFCILSENEMADGASPELRRVRRGIALQNEAVRARLSRIVSAAENRTLLQDAIVTMRQGRYVIPVKQEHRQRFHGIVHDQSATGATVFIEPQAVVNMNNELRELELAEAREVARILAELSAEVAEAGRLITANQDIIVALDFIFAKGRLSLRQKASRPGAGALLLL